MLAEAGTGKTARLLFQGPLFYLRRAPGAAILLILAVLFLTILTQVGGAVLWLWLPVGDLLGRALPVSRKLQKIAVAALFAPAYLAVTIGVVPALAGMFGRVPLACFPEEKSAYGPVTFLICLANRHYTTPSARTSLSVVAERLAVAAPGRRLSYLDAGFPFFAWFPMLPHLSHGDGRKIDLALLFVDPVTGRPVTGRARSPIGYWGYVQPGAGSPRPCEGRSSWLRWDFAWLQPLLPGLRLDDAAMRILLEELAASPRVSRVFVEPHVSARFGMAHPKIRFQGCAAARHDDHVHVEFR